jgi:hypothetical protein
MPVSEDPPFANALSSTKTAPMVNSPAPGLPLHPLQNAPAITCARGRSPSTSRTRPVTIMSMTVPENR